MKFRPSTVTFAGEYCVMFTYSFKSYHERLNTWTSFFVDIRLIETQEALSAIGKQ